MAGNMIGRVFSNRYQITELIGVGGMAEVYRAQDNVLGRVVAVKVMLPQYASDAEFTRRFKQEAASAANLQSPYIVNIYDWGQDEGTYFIVMEYVRGSDLKTAIKQRGAINQRKVAEIGAQVCQALSVAHGLDIIHRDIKPQNIMVQPDGNVKVMDFGIARAKNSVEAKTSSVLGTAHYISPEQAQGKDLTPASDIYSLGVVMYEAATGKLPFDGPDAVSVAMKQVQETPVPPHEVNPSIDATLEAIIMKAMEKQPSRRFATAKEMRRALNNFLAGRPVVLDNDSMQDFTSAQTTVMPGVPVANTMQSGTGAYSDGTAVMNPVGGSQGATKPSTQQTFDSNNTAKKNNGKKIGIIVAVIAALAVIGLAAAFAMGAFGGKTTENGIVPNVVGKSQTEATAEIEKAGFEVGDIETREDESVDVGTVLEQDPEGNTNKSKDTKINLVVAKAADKVEVPDLTGRTADEARKLLQASGLKYKAGTAEYSDSVEKDHVIRQDPAAGTQVTQDTEVTYILSLGSEGTEVPNVVGQAEGDATATLTNAGFKVTTSYTTSSTVSQGVVISQTPTAGEKGKEGDTVNLTISTGKSTHDVQATTDGNGTVTPAYVTVNDQGSATFTVKPYTGYVVSSIYDNYGASYSVSSSGGSFTISGVTMDTTIYVTFEQIQTNDNGTGDDGDNSNSGGDDTGDNTSGNNTGGTTIGGGARPANS